MSTPQMQRIGHVVSQVDVADATDTTAWTYVGHVGCVNHTCWSVASIPDGFMVWLGLVVSRGQLL